MNMMTMLTLMTVMTMKFTLNTPKYGAPAGKALAGLCFAVSDHDDRVDLDDHDDHVDLDDHQDHVDLDDHHDHVDHTEYPKIQGFVLR